MSKTERSICHACGTIVGERFFTIDPIMTEPYDVCDVCYRLERLGIIDYDGRLLVELREFDEEGYGM